MLSLLDFVLTSVNSEFTEVSVEVMTQGLSVVIIILGPGRDKETTNTYNGVTPAELSEHNALSLS